MVVAVVDDQRPAAVAAQARADRGGEGAARFGDLGLGAGRRIGQQRGVRRDAGRQRQTQRLAVGRQPDHALGPAARASSRTGAPAGRRRIRWRPAAAGPSGTSSKRACQARREGGERTFAARRCSGALMSTRWRSSAAWKPGTPRVARSASAISVPRPGPSSTSRTGCGRPIASQRSASQAPRSSPNIWEISGAVVKSPAAPDRQGACGNSRGGDGRAPRP